jgi:hypothetical protein
MNFDTPHVVQFISRIPAFQEPDEAHVGCTYKFDAVVRLLWAAYDYRKLSVEMFPEESGQ